MPDNRTASGAGQSDSRTGFGAGQPSCVGRVGRVCTMLDCAALGRAPVSTNSETGVDEALPVGRV